MDIQKAREKFAEINLKEGFYTEEELSITNLGVFECTAAEQDWEKWWECLIYYVEPMLQAQKVAVPETPKHKNGYYIRDLRNPIGNCMKFWYQCGYGTKHKNFFWCETLEEAKKYEGGCDWFEIWHAPYIDSLVEHTVDFQLADRNIGFVDLKAQEQVG